MQTILRLSKNCFLFVMVNTISELFHNSLPKNNKNWDTNA